MSQRPRQARILEPPQRAAQAPDVGPHGSAPRWAVAAGLAAGGAACWYFDRAHAVTLPQLVALTLAVMACAIPVMRRRFSAQLERLRQLNRRQVRRWTMGVFVATVAYLLLTATWQSRDFFPKWHDQQMTLIQAQMLARGRLWMPQHPCADFFETFYVFVKPLYAAIYFPGAAMFYVPTAWLHLPYWLEPLLIAGAVAALLFRIVSELLDPAFGLLAAVLLVSLWLFRILSLWVMPHNVFLLLSLAAIWAWLRWRQSRRTSWAILIGVALGWAAITRPVDALAYGIPLGLAILWDLRSESWRLRIITPAVMALVAAPFLSLQLAFDKKITGRYLETPFQYYYTHVEFAGLSPYGRMIGEPRATSALPQKQSFGKYFVIPTEREYAADSLWMKFRRRVETLLPSALPCGLLVVLLPLGLLAVRDVRWMVVCAPILPFLGGYMLYPLFLNHYCVAVAPGMILCVLLAMAAIGRAWPARRALAMTMLSAIVLAVSIASLPEAKLLAHAGHANPDDWDDTSWPVTMYNYLELPDAVNKPALVLYRYWTAEDFGTDRNFNDEPVYNVDVAWPDDAPIIRALDLGPRDAEIIEYYGRIQPERNVYVVARGDLKLHSIGKAGELAQRLRSGFPIRDILPPL